MYQVLYRKYRPKTFEDVCGQKVVVKLLKNSIKNDKISHAYLFAGPRGTGKTSMAKIFARIVNCENINNLTPCGTCVNCLDGSNDVIEIDAASNNGVDEIRELRNKVSLVPTSGKYKIYIIDEVHMLTTGAFNALLKTLEEPPAHVIFILATTDPHKIPETILSRCQRLDFQKISNDEIVEKLREIAQKEQIKVLDNVLLEIARLSDGGLRDSISLLDEASIYAEKEISVEDIHMINGTLTNNELFEFIKYINNSEYLKLFETVEKYNNCGKNFVKLTEELISCLKEILIYLVAPDYLIEQKKETNEFKNISREITKETIICYINEFNHCLNEMSKTNNYKLMFELSMIKLLNSDNESLGNISQNKKEKNNDSLSLSFVKNNDVKKNDFLLPKVEAKTNDKKEQKEKKEILKDEKNDNISLVDEEILSRLRDIRINNTLSQFNKKLLLELKKQLENITGFLLEPTYSQFVSIVMDGCLKASSDKNLIFVFQKKCVSDEFNSNLIIIEELLTQLFGKHYDVISTWDEEWEKVKNDFNTKKKKYVYKIENFNLNELLVLKANKDELITLFGDIIEYN